MGPGLGASEIRCEALKSRGMGSSRFGVIVYGLESIRTMYVRGDIGVCSV